MTAGMKVTPSEYHRLSWIAGQRGTDISNLLREMVTPLFAEYEKKQEAA